MRGTFKSNAEAIQEMIDQMSEVQEDANAQLAFPNVHEKMHHKQV